MKFECPHCEQRLSAEPNQYGRMLPCPECNTEFLVPEEDLPPLQVESNPAKSRIFALKTIPRIIAIFAAIMTAFAQYYEASSELFLIPWAIVGIALIMHVSQVPETNIWKSALYMSAIPFVIFLPFPSHAFMNVLKFLEGPSDSTMNAVFFSKYTWGTVLIYALCMCAQYSAKINQINRQMTLDEWRRQKDLRFFKEEREKLQDQVMSLSKMLESKAN